MKVILGNKYNNYDEALEILNLENLHARREKLCINFAIKCTKNDQTKNMFPEQPKQRNTKSANKYKVNFARTTKYLSSAIPQMQRLLNQQQKL